MTRQLTRVDIHFVPDRINHWLRFGEPRDEHMLDRRRAVVFFEPGQVFGYVRWLANDYGTILWRLYVLRAGGWGDVLIRVPGVRPGAEVLLGLAQPPKIKLALELIDGLEANGFAPAEIAPDYWGHVHNRLSVRKEVRPYGSVQHDAWLARRAVRP